MKNASILKYRLQLVKAYENFQIIVGQICLAGKTMHNNRSFNKILLKYICMQWNIQKDVKKETGDQAPLL